MHGSARNEIIMGIAFATLFFVAFEIASLRFGADTRETGDWHRIEHQGTRS